MEFQSELIVGAHVSALTFRDAPFNARLISFVIV